VTAGVLCYSCVRSREDGWGGDQGCTLLMLRGLSKLGKLASSERLNFVRGGLRRRTIGEMVLN